MISIETLYLSKLNRILLLAIGLWPYQQSKITQFQFVFFFGILMTSIIFQLTTFITKNLTSDVIVTVLASASASTIFIIKYYTFRVNIESIKKSFIKLQYICNELKDKNEIAIIEKYGYIAKCYTATLTIIGICSISVGIIVQFWSMFDVCLSTNISRSSRLYFVTEYFADQEKYYFLILLHMNLAIVIGGAAMVGTGTMLIAYFKFICGMFKISSYRIERALNINIMQNINVKNKISRPEDLIYAIDIHRQAIKLSKSLLSYFEVMFFCLAQMFVVSLCFNFVRIFQVILIEKATKEALMPVTFAIAFILYLFISNSLGQNITDHNNYVFTTVYRVEWYVTPLYIQRMILFLLIKGSKNFYMNVGLFIPSLECFATLVKASVSYFTVILSTQTRQIRTKYEHD